MQRNMVETVLGGVVLLVAAAFFAFAYKTGEVKTVDGYELTANFTRIDGLEAGSDVSVSGVKVGSVIDFSLDPATYLAKVRLSIRPDVKLPRDTAAIIASRGLLDGKYMALEPGGDEEMLKDGERIEFTQSTPGLEQLLGQVIFSLNNSKDKKDGDGEDDGGETNGAPAAAAPNLPEMP